jgi:hypothetical protein
MSRKGRSSRGKQRETLKDPLSGSLTDAVQGVISRLSQVPRTTEEDASQRGLLEQLQALFHDSYHDASLSDSLASLLTSGTLEKILGSEA